MGGDVMAVGSGLKSVQSALQHVLRAAGSSYARCVMAWSFATAMVVDSHFRLCDFGGDFPQSFISSTWLAGRAVDYRILGILRVTQRSSNSPPHYDSTSALLWPRCSFGVGHLYVAVRHNYI